MDNGFPKMELDLGHAGERDRFEFNESFRLAEKEIGEYDCEVAVDVDVTAMGSRYLLEAGIRCSIHGHCDRCLKECDNELKTDLEMVFQREGYSGNAPSGMKDSDFVMLSFEEEYCYDIFPRIMEAIVLEIPIKILCDEDCRGLCPVCGADLNEGDCGCVINKPDPRWEPLKKIVDKNRKE
jgi:uncharacterized protein